MDGSDELQSAKSVSFDDGLNSSPMAEDVAMESPVTTGGDRVGTAVGFPGVTVGRGVVGTGLGSGVGAKRGGRRAQRAAARAPPSAAGSGSAVGKDDGSSVGAVGSAEGSRRRSRWAEVGSAEGRGSAGACGYARARGSEGRLERGQR